MGFKVFADANMLLDVLLQRDQAEEARRILALAMEGSVVLFTTPAVLHICAWWTQKSYGNQKSKELLLVLLADVTIVDCDHATVLVALNSRMDDVEDALQYYTALQAGLDFFISGDRKLKKTSIPQLPVYTTSEFLHLIKDSSGI